ncbi:Wadjet anti-phage system protein JetA family protein [Mesorhizobium sp. LNJC405B00]|uniref:Wadjet anti-phage system protein JetA family protein n=1 Tax=unclassified Mesorhizobium TaxID=325217 RepID=UPI000ACF1082|nr:Wadjet anti-phage system protein JetA family protein [Mesorhizobium sp. LNJC405B00]
MPDVTCESLLRVTSRRCSHRIKVPGEHAELWREDEAPIVLDQLATRRGRRIRRRKFGSGRSAGDKRSDIRARHIYNRLIATGWIEESRYGLKVTVDMPAGAMRLAEFLCDLREGLTEQLSGLVIQVKNELDALLLNARENAPGLHKAARDAATFGRYLRSVLSALREIDKQVLASDSVGRRLRHYFEDFVERILLQDYAAISTTSHPYRFRHRIFTALDSIEDSIADVGAIAEAYCEVRLAPDITAARDLVYDDLHKVRRVFDQIEEAFERIQQHRSRLETRLRNTVRYAGRRGGTFLQRSKPIMLRLDKLLGGHRADYSLSGLLESRQTYWSPLLLARARNYRTTVTGGVLVLPPPDPLREIRKQLERGYLNRLAVTPEKVSRFLEKRVPPFGASDASHFWIDNVDDFLAFETLRLSVLAADQDGRGNAIADHLASAFGFSPALGHWVDNAWLSCTGFTVTRRGDSITLEGSHAQ